PGPHRRHRTSIRTARATILRLLREWHLSDFCAHAQHAPSLLPAPTQSDEQCRRAWALRRGEVVPGDRNVAPGNPPSAFFIRRASTSSVISTASIVPYEPSTGFRECLHPI